MGKKRTRVQEEGPTDDDDGEIVIVEDDEEDEPPKKSKKSTAPAPSKKPSAQAAKKPKKKRDVSEEIEVEDEEGDDEDEAKPTKRSLAGLLTSRPSSQATQPDPSRRSLPITSYFPSGPQSQASPPNPTPTPAPTQVLPERLAEKYVPRKTEELAMSKKKVDEIREWFTERAQSSRGAGPPSSSHARFYASTSQPAGRMPRGNLLVLSGPPGTGKSLCVRLLAAEMGFRVAEFTPSALTSWEEAQFMRGGGDAAGESIAPSYRSRIDEFVSFIGRTSDYSALPILGAGGGGGKSASKLLLIEDLPHVHNADASSMLVSALLHLNSGATPTVLVMTENESQVRDEKRSKVTSTTGELNKDLVLQLREAGATHISVPALTPTAISKALGKLMADLRLPFNATVIKEVAEKCGGDMRSALESLQMFGRKKATREVAIKPAPKSKSGTTTTTRGKETFGEFARESGLNFFHGLAKFLYNKREVPSTPEFEACQAHLPKEFRRPPLGNNVEQVISSTGLEGSEVVGFLHENYTDFIDEPGIKDAMMSLAYFSESDILLSGWSQGETVFANDERDTTLREAAASSIAARGLCFSNQTPAPRTFRSLRPPVLGPVSKAVNLNVEEMGKMRLRLLDRLQMSQTSFPCFAGEIIPLAKLGTQATRLQPASWTHVYSGKAETQFYDLPSIDDDETGKMERTTFDDDLIED